MASPSANMFGLSEAEVRIALCGLKVFITDGKVEKAQLAALTGHSNPDSALRAWQIVKKKMMDESTVTSTAPTGSQASTATVQTPTKAPKKTPSKKGSAKKVAKRQVDQEEDGPDVDRPKPKRVKKEMAADTDAVNPDNQVDNHGEV